MSQKSNKKLCHPERSIAIGEANRNAESRALRLCAAYGTQGMEH